MIGSLIPAFILLSILATCSESPTDPSPDSLDSDIDAGGTYEKMTPTQNV